MSAQTQLRATFSLQATPVKATAYVLAPGCHVMQVGRVGGHKHPPPYMLTKVNGQVAGDPFGQCPWLQVGKDGCSILLRIKTRLIAVY
jgi:hypothetical protein